MAQENKHDTAGDDQKILMPELPIFTIPDNLRLKSDGTLYCADGTDVKTYLARFSHVNGLEENQPVSLSTREGMKKMFKAYIDSYILLQSA